MSIRALTPYLFFNGTAEKAVRLYERALGAKTEALLRYGDHPEPAGTCAPDEQQRVMHALLRVGEAQLMLSDAPTDKPEARGGNVQVCLDFEDVRNMVRKFEALASTGKITLGLHDTFWGATFGALVDEFGIHWMFNCMTKAQ